MGWKVRQLRISRTNGGIQYTSAHRRTWEHALRTDHLARADPARMGRLRRQALARAPRRSRELREEGRVDRIVADVRLSRGSQAHRSDVAPGPRGAPPF